MHLVIFDLDGTLVDSFHDIATSVNELLAGLGRPPLSDETIHSFVGNGVRALVDRSLGGASPSELDESLARYLTIYRRHLLDTTRPYPGVREALGVLHPQAHLAVLTNKPRREAVSILEGLGMDHFFGWVLGGESMPRRKPDPIGVEALIREAGVSAGRTLFVGDSRVDRETARNAGVSFCLVSYGRDSAELRTLDPDFIVDDCRELVAIVRRREGSAAGRPSGDLPVS